MILRNGRVVRGFGIGQTPAVLSVEPKAEPDRWVEILAPAGILVLIAGVWYFVSR